MCLGFKVPSATMRLNLHRHHPWLQHSCAYQTSTSYCRAVPQYDSDGLEDKWVYQKSEQLGNLVLLHEGERNENKVVSPLSLQVVLSFLAAAYDSRPRRQLLKLFAAHSHRDLNYFSSQISRTFSGNRNGGDPRMRCSNTLWLDPSLSLKPSFRRTLHSHYDSPLYPSHFHSEAPYVTKKINSWVETETCGLVKDLLCEGSLDNSVKLVFTNTLYFKGSWDEDPPLPTEEDGVDYENYVMAPFLAKRKVFGDDSYGWARLNHPFKKQSDDKRAYNMLFFYPPTHNLFYPPRWIKEDPNLVIEIPTDDRGNMAPSSINFGDEILMDVCGIMTPKFSISSEVEPSRVLRGQGVTLPFSPGKLAAMSRSFDDQEFYVSNIFHKAFIEINEQGTEAAASTATIVMSGAPLHLPEAPEIFYIPHHPGLLHTRIDENGDHAMAKTRLVVQAINPVARKCAYILCS